MGLGKAGAAVVAPEAVAAQRATAGRRPRKITPDMSKAEIDQELQQRAAEAKARKDNPPAPAPTAPATPPPASPGGGPSMPSVPLPAAAATGSGFLLGVFAWAVGLAYLQGGAPQVKKFFKAKFLNQT